MISILSTTCRTPFRLSQRPAGDYVVQRFANGRIERFALPTKNKRKATQLLADANLLLERALGGTL